MPIAPISMDIPQPRLSDIIAPEEEGKIYIGPNIDWTKIPGFLSQLLTLMDPTGMGGAMPGFIYRMPAVSSWVDLIKSGGQESTKWDIVRKIGDRLEQAFPRLKQFTKETPVSFLGPHPANTLLRRTQGQYAPTSPAYPKGLIRLYEGGQPSTLGHEAMHRLYAEDPFSQMLTKEMLVKSDPNIRRLAEGTIGYLNPKLSYPEFLSEYLAYGAEPLVGTKPGMSLVRFPKEYKEKLLTLLKNPEMSAEEFEKLLSIDPSKLSATQEILTDVLSSISKGKDIRDVYLEDLGKTITKGAGRHKTAITKAGRIVEPTEPVLERGPFVPAFERKWDKATNSFIYVPVLQYTGK